MRRRLGSIGQPAASSSQALRMRPASRAHEGMAGHDLHLLSPHSYYAALLLLGPRALDSSRVVTAVHITGESAGRTGERKRTPDCEGTSSHHIVLVTLPDRQPS